MPDFNSRIGKLVMACIIAFCAAIIFVAVIAFVWAVGPAAERANFPVVGKLQVLDSIEVEPGITEIHAKFTKRRDCEYVSVAWYVGHPNEEYRQVRVQTIVDEAQLQEIVSPTRPLGTSIAGPWRIAMSLNDFENNSFAILTHRCHPFWLTTTNFYP